MKITPDNRKAHTLGFPGPGGQLERIARPFIFFRIDPQSGGFRIRPAKLGDHGRQGIEPPHLGQIDESLYRFPLAEIVTEISLPIRSLDPVRALEPVGQELARCIAGSVIIQFPPFVHGGAQRIDHQDRRRTAVSFYIRRPAPALGAHTVTVRLFPWSE